jgi:methionyl-tRNA formyltransferase
MKLIFAGTPPFAAVALRALCAAGHEIALVLTQPDRPAGRGLKLTPSAVAVTATKLDLPMQKPATLKNADVQAGLAAIGADVMVVAAYGLILPQAVLDLPRLGCINIHGSLLPRWRGAAPVQRAIEAGDAETGIAIMQMEAGLDTGPVLLERRIAIAADDTSATLFAKLTDLGAIAIVDALAQLEAQKLPPPQPQSAAGVTYASKVDKAEAKIDWSASAAVLERKIRAFDPFPGCETHINEGMLKIWRATVLPSSSTAEPGTILSANEQALTVQCGDDALSLQIIQRPGGKRLTIGEFMRSARLRSGEVLR